MSHFSVGGVPGHHVEPPRLDVSVQHACYSDGKAFLDAEPLQLGDQLRHLDQKRIALTEALFKLTSFELPRPITPVDSDGINKSLVQWWEGWANGPNRRT